MRRSRLITMSIGWIGFAVVIVGVVFTERISMVGVGILCGVVAWQVFRRRADDERIYECGRDAGYDAGFMDGRRIAKPVIVPFPAEDQQSTNRPLMGRAQPRASAETP